MLDQAKESDTGSGPYSVRHDDERGTYYIWGPEGKIDKAYPLRKTANRRCRELNSSPAPVPFTTADVAEIDAEIEGALTPFTTAEVAEVINILKSALTGPDGETPDLEPIPAELEPSLEELDGTEIERFSSAPRHEWLEKAGMFAASLLRERTDLEVPHTIRISVGWPTGRKAIGECWHMEASRDGHREIFVSPALDDGVKIVDVLIHEMIHACLPKEAKHGPLFGRPARAVGLEGKLTATYAGEALKLLLEEWVLKEGQYPAKGLDRHMLVKKQTTRLIKAKCPMCDYTVRLTRVWVEKGLPICPVDDSQFELA